MDKDPGSSSESVQSRGVDRIADEIGRFNDRYKKPRVKWYRFNRDPVGCKFIACILIFASIGSCGSSSRFVESDPTAGSGLVIAAAGFVIAAAGFMIASAIDSLFRD